MNWGAAVSRLIDEREIDELRAAYGTPVQRLLRVEADDFLYFTRLQKSENRRGEVCFALRRHNGHYLLHTKNLYPGVYRLPTGGVLWGEPVRETLPREVMEETGLTISNVHFLAVLGYEFAWGSRILPFVTYLFFVEEDEGYLRPDAQEVSGFSEVPLRGLRWAATTLRRLPAPRQAWGTWRALAHDVSIELLQTAAWSPERTETP